jgi:hypothetical protein
MVPKGSKVLQQICENAWDDLAKEMKITPDECRKKITSLNASFRREKMKTKNSQRTGTGNYKTIFINIKIIKIFRFITLFRIKTL